MLIAWNFSSLPNTFDITLPPPGFWIKSTFISTKVSCHRNGLVLTCVCVSQYFKYTLYIYFGIVQPKIVLPRIQAMYYDEKSFHMFWPSFIITIEFFCYFVQGRTSCINICQWKNLPLYMNLKWVVKNCELELGHKNNLFLSSLKVLCEPRIVPTCVLNF